MTYGSFAEFYEVTSMDGNNEEFADLVELHMGGIMKAVMNDWLKEAFNAGRRCPDPSAPTCTEGNE